MKTKNGDFVLPGDALGVTRSFSRQNGPTMIMVISGPW